MTSTQENTRTEQKIELHGGSPVRSNDDKAQHVHAVCHHSERYLSRSQTYPQQSRRPLFREHHDFPGIPSLDKRFVSAAHALDELHFTWNVPALIGALMILCGILLVIDASMMLDLLQARSVTWVTPLYYSITALMLVIGMMFIFDRTHVYHRFSTGRAPAVDDFPLDGTYEVLTTERLTVTLGNTSNQPPVPSQQQCWLEVKVYPEETNLEEFRAYHRLYRQFVDRVQLYAGLIALENHKAVQFAHLHLDNAHQLKLRAPIPTALLQGHYDREENPLLNIVAPYTIEESAFYGKERNLRVRRFPLECVPQLSAYDSYTLELHFRWRGNKEEPCWINECTLTFPPELDVKHVEFGRYEREIQQAIWRDLYFPSGDETQLRVLSVTCRHPILSYHGTISGTYCCTREGPISQFKISPDRIWNARGLKAAIDKRPVIEQKTIVEGELIVDTKQLMQEHEHICCIKMTCYPQPEQDLVKAVLDAFVKQNIDLLRIEHAAPRLDPAGTLRTQLYYWDIVGRHYQQEMIDSIDIHIVISGHNHTNPLSTASDGLTIPIPPPQIDIRVRCLHDPRNNAAPERADMELNTLRDELNSLALQEKNLGVE